MVKVLIGISCHKKGNFYTSLPFIPIQVGAAFREDIGIQRDSDGDNISSHNPYFCEMSAVYWLWKNTEADYKGLFHYRRFLTFDRQSFLKRIPNYCIYWGTKVLSPFLRDVNFAYFRFPVFHVPEEDTSKVLGQFANDLEKDILNKGTDCYALGHIKYSTKKMKSILMESIGIWHFNKLNEIIKERYPDFYLYFDKTLYSHNFCSCNIIIAKNDLYNEYCTILFSILKEYVDYMNSNLSSDQINTALFRDPAYISEFITDAYISMIKDRGCKVRHLGQVTVDIATGTESQHETTFVDKIKEAFK